MKTRHVALILAMVGLTALPSGLQAAPAPTIGECRSQGAGERANLTSDDVVNCVVGSASATRLRVGVTYTYASPLGRQNIWMGIDVLSGGNRLKWFGYRPVAITGGSGTAEFEIIYGLNDPPKGKLTTDQIEFFMYVGRGQIFHRRLFTLKHDWQL